MDVPSLRSSAIISPFGARLLLWSVGLVLLIPGLGGPRLLTYHEVVFAQPAREMLASGRWLVPEIAGVVFPDKPPLAHWTAALGMVQFGENEFAVRLPFALAGVLLAALVTELGIAFWGAVAGAAAGLIQLTCFYTLMQARLAECDILLALAVTGGLTAFAFVEVLSRPFALRYVLALHAGAAGAFLAKGPIGLVFLGGPILAFLILERRAHFLARWLHPVGLLVSLSAVVGWPLAAALSRPEIIDGWKQHNLDRFSGALEAEATRPTFYLTMIPLLLLPWTPWIVWGWWSHRRTDRRDVARLRRFTLCWIIPGLIVISAASWRHKHYAIPLLPPLSLWGAAGVMAWSHAARRSISAVNSNRSGIADRALSSDRIAGLTRLQWRLAIAVTLIGAGLALARQAGSDNFDVLWPLAFWIPLGSAVVSQLRSLARLRLATIALFITVGVTSAWSLQRVVPRFDSYADQAVFAQRISARIGDEPLFVPHIPTGPGVPLALPENQIAFYLPLNLHLMPDDGAQTNPAEWVLAPAWMGSRLNGFTAVDQVDRIRGLMTPADRLTLFHRSTTEAHRAPRDTQYAN